MKIHYADSSGWAACGVKKQFPAYGHVTAIVSKVTCNKCKDTREYKEMTEEEPL